MKIITVSRQFGSGGRELGKRLSDILGFDYYDKEIITAIADAEGGDPDEVRRVLSSHGWKHYPMAYRHSFQQVLAGPWEGTEAMARQREVILKIAEAGNDCVIVGRDADVILRDYAPLRTYVCAEMDRRLERCMEFEGRKTPEEQLTEKQVLKNIKRIDRNRMRTREILTGKNASDSSSFDITVNTTGWEIKALSEAVAGFAGHWFARNTGKQQ